MATVASNTNMEIGARLRPAYEANAYAIICRAGDDPALLSALLNQTSDGKRTLEDAGITGADDQRELLEILKAAAIGKHQQEEAARLDRKHYDETMAVVSAMKAGLKGTIKQIDSAFNQTMWMYAISFYMGVALVIAAIVFAFDGKGQLLSMVLGGLGTANTLTFFFTKPPERLQSSRASLAQLQCALLNWFNDFVNQNILMSQMNQSQINSGKELDPKPYHTLSETLMKHTDDMMQMLQKYCKLIEKPSLVQASSHPAAPTSKPDPSAPAEAGAPQ